jgi:nicotinamide phosphoribosyltransferase
MPSTDAVVVFGIQSFVKKYLIDYFNEHFFGRPKEEVIAEYTRYLHFVMGIEAPDATHIEELHDLGHIPIKITALKEGTLAPIKVPILTIVNTNPKFFWFTNYLETLLSAEIWQPMTTATLAYQYRKLLDEYAIKTTGSTEGVKFQAHDFSMRGMPGLDAAAASGAAHLLSFTGTDTIPAIVYHEKYYNANIEHELVAASIPATEHSVMSAATDADTGRDETAMFKRLLTEVYPSGFFSVVSDTYDFWKVIGEILPSLKEEIMNRDGRMVIRPDSGDPVLIICGDPNGKTELERKGLIQALYEIIGGTVNSLGYKVLDTHIGAIYGDSITLERARQIVERLEAKGFASTNVVLGIGSYSYQYVTRDTGGFAMKATHAEIDGVERMLFKDPKTDDGTKRSQRGLVAVVSAGNTLTLVDGLDKATYQRDFANIDQLETVFENGVLVRDQSLSGIRELLHPNGL